MVVTAGWRGLRTAGIAWGIFSLAAGSGFAAPPKQPMVFEWRTVADGRSAIVAEGVVAPETPEAFQHFASSRGVAAGTVVWLNSDGGDLEGGLALGRTIRRLGFNTMVGDLSASGITAGQPAPGRCVSACSLAFLGGVERGLLPGSDYGVHQLRMECVERWQSEQRYPWLPLPGVRYCPEFDDAMSAFQSAQGAVTAYVAEMGADPLLVSEMANVSASTLRFLEAHELSALRIVTDAGRDTEPD